MNKTLLLLCIMIISLNAFAQSENTKKLFTLDGNDIGGYIGLNGKMTTVNSLTAGWVDIKLAVVINKKWAIGYNTSGLINDRHLHTLVSDGLYHLLGSYQGIFIERIFLINNDLRYSFSVLVGQGEIEYKYCRSVIAEKKWYEETIDKTDYYIIEPSFDIYYNVWGNFWMGLNAGYNCTTAIRMMDTDRGLLNKFTGGLSLKYGLF